MFFHEGSVLTWLSFLQLVMVAGFSWQLFKLQQNSSIEFDWKEPGRLWAIIAIGFLFLAFDEMFKIHETLDQLIHLILRIEETKLTDRIDDLIIGIYGLVGLLVLFRYRQELMKQKPILPFLVAGFLFMLLMVACDMLTSQNDIISDDRVLLKFVLAEDSLKLFAEAIFMVGFYHGFRQTRIHHTLAV
ncbi:MAG: hypothetical protein OEU26_08630 [Candidatus Tectomicrobia bacterium]|nr:hypothetical protein [Candidatus Tectomicrobia bacterium]